MPSSSLAQAKLMAALAHGWHPPKSSGIHVPLAVALEFNQIDKGTGIRNRRKVGPLQAALYSGRNRRMNP